MQLVFISLLLTPAIRADEITIASWGGAHTQSLQQAYYQPFTDRTGVEINSHIYTGGLKQLKQQVDSGSVLWDVLDMSAADMQKACDDGLLEKLPIEQFVNVDENTTASDDFLPGSLSSCAVGYAIWSTVFVFNQHDFTAAQPTQIKDLFDVEKFPGKRGLPYTPRGLLEWALIADGADSNAIYSLLSTRLGVERAFNKLQSIKTHIVWWKNVGEMESLLESSSVVMGAAYSSTMFDAVVKRQRTLGFVWDAQLLNTHYFAIPKGSYRFASAWQFAHFVGTFDRMPMLNNYVAYGPARRSSHTRINSEYLPYLPTADENYALGFQQDDAWWAENQQAMNARFIEWLARPSASE